MTMGPGHRMPAVMPRTRLPEKFTADELQAVGDLRRALQAHHAAKLAMKHGRTQVERVTATVRARNAVFALAAARRALDTVLLGDVEPLEPTGTGK